MKIEKIEISSWKTVLLDSFEGKIESFLNKINYDRCKGQWNVSLDQLAQTLISELFVVDVWKIGNLILSCTKQEECCCPDAFLDNLKAVVQIILSPTVLKLNLNETKKDVYINDCYDWLRGTGIVRSVDDSVAFVDERNSAGVKRIFKNLKKRSRSAWTRSRFAREPSSNFSLANDASDRLSESDDCDSSASDEPATENRRRRRFSCHRLIDDSDGFLAFTDNDLDPSTAQGEIDDVIDALFYDSAAALDPLVLDMLYGQLDVTFIDSQLIPVDLWCALFLALLIGSIGWKNVDRFTDIIDFFEPSMDLHSADDGSDHAIDSSRDSRRAVDSSRDSRRALDTRLYLLRLPHALGLLERVFSLRADFSTLPVDYENCLNLLLKNINYLCRLLGCTRQCAATQKPSSFCLDSTGRFSTLKDSNVEHTLECVWLMIGSCLRLSGLLFARTRARELPVAESKATVRDLAKILFSALIRWDFQTLFREVLVVLDFLASIKYPNYCSTHKQASVEQDLYAGKVLALLGDFFALMQILNGIVTTRRLCGIKLCLLHRPRDCPSRTSHCESFEIQIEGQSASCRNADCGLRLMGNLFLDCYCVVISPGAKTYCLSMLQHFRPCCCDCNLSIVSRIATIFFNSSANDRKVILNRTISLLSDKMTHGPQCAAHLDVELIEIFRSRLLSHGDQIDKSFISIFKFLNAIWLFLPNGSQKSFTASLILPFLVQFVGKLSEERLNFDEKVVNLCTSLCNLDALDIMSYEFFVDSFIRNRRLSDFLLNEISFRPYAIRLLTNFAMAEEKLCKFTDFSSDEIKKSPINRYLLDKLIGIYKLVDSDLLSVISIRESWLQFGQLLVELIDLSSRLCRFSISFKAFFDKVNGQSLLASAFESALECLAYFNTNLISIQENLSVVRFNKMSVSMLELLSLTSTADQLAQSLLSATSTVKKFPSKFVVKNLTFVFWKCCCEMKRFSSQTREISVSVECASIAPCSSAALDTLDDSGDELSDEIRSFKEYAMLNCLDSAEVQSDMLNGQMMIGRSLFQSLLLAHKLMDRADFYEIVLQFLKNIRLPIDALWIIIASDERCFRDLITILELCVVENSFTKSAADCCALLTSFLFDVCSKTKRFDKFYRLIGLFAVDASNNFRTAFLAELTSYFDSRVLEPSKYLVFPVKKSKNGGGPKLFAEILASSSGDVLPRPCLKVARSNSFCGSEKTSFESDIKAGYEISDVTKKPSSKLAQAIGPWLTSLSSVFTTSSGGSCGTKGNLNSLNRPNVGEVHDEDSCTTPADAAAGFSVSKTASSTDSPLKDGISVAFWFSTPAQDKNKADATLSTLRSQCRRRRFRRLMAETKRVKDHEIPPVLLGTASPSGSMTYSSSPSSGPSTSANSTRSNAGASIKTGQSASTIKTGRSASRIKTDQPASRIETDQSASRIKTDQSASSSRRCDRPDLVHRRRSYAIGSENNQANSFAESRVICNRFAVASEQRENSRDEVALSADRSHLLSFGDGRIACSLSLLTRQNYVATDVDLLLQLIVDNRVIYERILRRVVPKGEWCHVIASAKLNNDEIFTVVIHANGRFVHRSSLRQYLQAEGKCRLNVFFGSTSTTIRQKFDYSLANIFVFDGVLDSDQILLLHAYGARMSDLVEPLNQSLDPVVYPLVDGSLIADAGVNGKFSALGQSSQIFDDQLGLADALRRRLRAALLASRLPSASFHPVTSFARDEEAATSTACGDDERVTSSVLNDQHVTSSARDIEHVTPSARDDESMTSTMRPVSALASEPPLSTKRLTSAFFCSYADDVRDMARSKKFWRDVDASGSGVGDFPPTAGRIACVSYLKLIQRLGVDDAIDGCGGIKLILFLFAKATETKNEGMQRLSLKLVFSARKRSPAWKRIFDDLNGIDVVLQVLSSTFFAFSESIIFDLLDFVLARSPPQKKFIDCRLNQLIDAENRLQRSSFVVQDPQTLTNFVCCFDLWKNNLQLWILALKTMDECLLDTKFGVFNTERLASADFLKNFLFFITELHQQELMPNSVDSKVLVHVITGLVSNILCSPRVNETTILCDFLFLTHPATSTYLSFAPISTLDWITSDLLSESYPDVALYNSPLALRLGQLAASFSSCELQRLVMLDHSVLFKEIIYSNDSLTDRKTDSVLTVTSDYQVDNASCSNDRIGNVHSSAAELDYEGMSEIRAYFFELLSNLLITVTDRTFDRLIDSVVKWRHILVMLRRQKNERVRHYCLKVLAVLLIRFSPQDKLIFCKGLGFSLLTNLILEYPCTSGVMDCLFSIMCNSLMRMDDGIDASSISALVVDKYLIGSLRPIFAAIEKSTHDVTLFWNAIGCLKKVFENNFALADAMLEYVPECFVTVLLKLSSLESDYVDVDNMNESDLLLESWLSFCSSFVCYTFGRFGLQYFQYLSSLLHLLFLADLYAFRSGPSSHNHVRGTFCTILIILLNFAEEIVSEEGIVVSTSKYENFKTATRTEIFDRFKLILQYCVELFTILPANRSGFNDGEHRLFNKLLSFFCHCLTFDSNLQCAYSNVASVLGGRSTLIVGSLPKARHLFVQFLSFFFYPTGQKLLQTDCFISKKSPDDLISVAASNVSRRLDVVESLAQFFDESSWKTLFESADNVNKSAIVHAILELRFCHSNLLSDEQKLICESVYEQARRASQLPTAIDELKLCDKPSDCDFPRLCDAERKILTVYIAEKRNWLDKMTQLRSRLRQYKSKMAQAISSASMAVTCATVEEQNLPRKLHIKHKRSVLTRAMTVREHWKQLVADLCHPEAPCFDPAFWPKSWSLDLHEGARRERRRLLPQHINIPAKFFQADKQYKCVPLAPGPLFYLTRSIDALTRRAGDLASAERSNIDEKIIFTCRAQILRLNFEYQGELLLGDRHLFFSGQLVANGIKMPSSDATLDYPNSNDNDSSCVRWSYVDFVEIYRRLYQLCDKALEFFLSDGQTCLISFESNAEREHFLHRLLQIDLPNLVIFADNALQTVTQWWRERNLTNYEYLMYLNKFAGRTFNDLMQYPVFPFILSEYTSDAIDLNNFNVYRNLAKPIAIQNKTMEQHYIDVYKSLENDYNRAISEGHTSSLMFHTPYNYSSHYSNSGIVIHFLARLPPFTQLALDYQDNSFDVPDRTFHSIATTWRLSSLESTSDFKELIPEFFIMPEFLVNFEGFNFGRMQSGRLVSDVLLPCWCPHNDARLFILLHRQALESHYVTANLHQWLDLIFGYKQRGQASIDAVNVFHPVTYWGTDLVSDQTSHENNPDAAHEHELKAQALNAMVRTYGQMPRQLFKAPHLPPFVKQQIAVTPRLKSPIPSVSGVKWGSYVGSPDEPEPILVLKQRHYSYRKPNTLFSLADGSCVAVAQNSLPVIVYKANKRNVISSAAKETDQIYLVTWRFVDQSVVRCSSFSPDCKPCWISLFNLPNSAISSTYCYPGSTVCFFGLESGLILVYRLEFADQKPKACRLIRTLYGHKTKITCLFVCQEYNTVLSCDSSGAAMLWDLNTLLYVRSLTVNAGPIICCAVSRTNCDIVTSHNSYVSGSTLTLHTVNGNLVGTVSVPEYIRSIAISSADEGVSVNCVIAGLSNGSIRLWDCWTLNLMYDLTDPIFKEPVISLCYTMNSSKLYACTESGTILCWESAAPVKSSKHSRPCRFTFLDA